MKLSFVITMCMLLILAVAGCNSDEEISTIQKNDTTEVNAITDDMTGEPSEDPDFPDGSSQPLEEVTLPDIFPLYPDAELFTAFEKDGVNTIEYHSQDNIEDICDFYINELSAAGYEIFSSNCDKEEAVIETSINGAAYSIIITDYSGITEIKVFY